MFKVLFVCHGNICRSTMAEFIFRHMSEQRSLSSELFVDSAATSDDDIGAPVYRNTLEQCALHGIPVYEHFARQLTKKDYRDFDCIVGMDSMNMRDMLSFFGGDSEGKLCLILDHTDDKRDVKDPWYTRDFETAYKDITAGCAALLEHLIMNGVIE